MSWLPSGKFFRTLFIILLVVGVIVGLHFFRNRPKDSIGVTVRDDQEFIAASDTDGDKLADWEEALWRTDAENADTDHDGTIDGDEVSKNRDPRIAGPNDTFASLAETATTTYTGDLSRIFLTNFLASTEESGVFDPALALQHLNEIAPTALPEPVAYTYTELRVVDAETPFVRELYGETLRSILLAHQFGQTDPLGIFIEAVDGEAPGTLVPLADLASSYTTIAHGLARIQGIPNDIASIHLDLVNTFLITSRNMTALTNIATDPLIAYAGLQNYLASSEKIGTLLSVIVTYITE